MERHRDGSYLVVRSVCSDSAEMQHAARLRRSGNCIGAVTADRGQLIQPHRVHAGRVAVVAGAEEGVPALSQAGRELLSVAAASSWASCVRATP